MKTSIWLIIGWDIKNCPSPLLDEKDYLCCWPTMWTYEFDMVNILHRVIIEL